MWNDLTMSERTDVIKMAVKAGLKDMKSIRKFYDDSLKYADGGPKKSFDDWYKTVPVDRNDTTNYDLRRAYELAPIEELESWRTSSIEDLRNNKNHLRSVYEDPNTGIYNFVKSKNHPTVGLELDWYNSKDAADFRSKYDLDTSGDYYRYVPKPDYNITLPEVTVLGNKKAEGGSIHISPSKRGTFTAAATKHGMGVQEFASKVLANKDNYSPAMVKKANFAKNASKWKHGLGGYLFEEGGPKNTNREYKSANSWSPSNLHKIFTPLSSSLINFGERGEFARSRGGTPEETYFLPKNIQRQEFLSRGYTEAPNDYGLVKRAVNNRNIPVYQTKADDISREEVFPIGNISDIWFGKKEARLEHPGHYPTAVYYSPYTNEYYQKGWDLNDYGGGSGTYNNYDAFGKIRADIADAIGSPVVTTTGISRIGSLTDMMKEKATKNIAIDFLNSKGLIPLRLDTKESPLLNIAGRPMYDLKGKPVTYTISEYVPSLPEITITGKRRKKVK